LKRTGGRVFGEDGREIEGDGSGGGLKAIGRKVVLPPPLLL